MSARTFLLNLKIIQHLLNYIGIAYLVAANEACGTRPPDPQQILPNNAQKALLASAKSHYGRLVTQLNLSLLKQGSPVFMQRQQPHDKEFLQHVDQLKTIAQANPPNPGVPPPFSLRFLEDSAALDLGIPLINIAPTTLGKDIRQITGDELRDAAPRSISASASNAPAPPLQYLSNLFIVIAVCSAYLDHLRIPHPTPHAPDAPTPPSGHDNPLRKCDEWILALRGIQAKEEKKEALPPCGNSNNSDRYILNLPPPRQRQTSPRCGA